MWQFCILPFDYFLTSAQPLFPPLKMASARSKLYSFTINNPTEVDRIPRGFDHVMWAKWQEERAPTTGTLHLQGVVKFTSLKTLAQVKVMHATAHWEIGRSQSKLLEYVDKEETRVSGPYSFGDLPPGQGARTDLERLQAAIESGMSIVDIQSEFFGLYLRYQRAITHMVASSLSGGGRDAPTSTLVLYGPPGSGKSFLAHDLGGESAFYLPIPKDNSPVWFDGYLGQKTIVIEDFYGRGLSRNFLLRLLDEAPMQVPFKGGFVPLGNVSVIFTSNVHPIMWYNKLGLGALERRLAGPRNAIKFMGLDFGERSEFAGMSELAYYRSIRGDQHGTVPILKAPVVKKRKRPVAVWPPVAIAAAVEEEEEDEIESFSD